MRKNYTLYLFLLSLVLLNIIIFFSCIKTKNNQDEYFRLHVVANSNSVDDQIIKLNVVKKINNYLNNLTTNMNISDKNKTKLIIQDNVEQILEIASNELIKQNAKYSCYANIGKIHYEEKKSDVLDMDKGTYDSLRIILGEGNGENFWSLIFPYSYNESYDTVNNPGNVSSEDIEIKSIVIETIQKVVKTFKS